MNEAKFVSKCFISSVFISDNKCPEIPCFSPPICINVPLRPWFRTFSWNNHTGISDNGNNVHFLDVKLTCFY